MFTPDHNEQPELDISRDAGRIDWRILREGRAWESDEASQRYDLTPEKLEMWEGKLLFEDNDRLLLLGLLLENIGTDRAVQFGDPNVWRAAVARITSSTDGTLIPEGG